MSEGSRMCSASCLVHGRRWQPTFLYLLNQCHNRLAIPRPCGKNFTTFLCSCPGPHPDNRQYFQTEEHLQLRSHITIRALRTWPPECVVILQPFISQLESLPTSDIRESLIKFVYCFDSCSHGNMEFLLHPMQSERNQNATETTVDQSSDVADAAIPFGSLNLTSLVTENESSLDTEPMKVSPSTASKLAATSQQEPRQKVPLERQPGCLFHGPSYKYGFQYILNTMHRQDALPTKYNRPFSRAVCVCNGPFDRTELYNSNDDIVRDVKYANTILDKWGDLSCTQPFRKLLTNSANSRTVPDGLVAYVFYVKKVYEKDHRRFLEIFDSMKRSHN